MKQEMSEALSGFLLLNKPIGMTSHTLVAQVRKKLGVKRVGHAGTLDPFATGLMMVLVGHSTVMSQDLLGLDKVYEFEIKLGVETDTLDSTGQITEEQPIPELTEALLKATLQEFEGEIEQVPPAYSALKFQGRPLYEYMRTQGKLPMSIENKRRKITIYSLELLSHTKTTITCRAHVSSGTYIRVLAADIAKKLGTVGHCSVLNRSRIGQFLLMNSCSLDSDLSLNHPTDLFPFEKVYLTQEFDKALDHGQKVPCGKDFSNQKVFVLASHRKSGFLANWPRIHS